MKSHNYVDFLKSADKPIAFVLGCDISGLGVMRNLGRLGIPIIGLDADPKEIGLFSKFCTGIICPHPKHQTNEFIEFLVRLGEHLPDKGILMATEDAELRAILQHRTKLEKYFRFPMAKLSVVEKLLNKKFFYQTLEKFGMPHPTTYFSPTLSEVQEISKNIDYPCMIKPEYSHYFRDDFQTKAFIARDREELISCYGKAHEKHHEVMIQEIIPGKVTCMYGLNAYYDTNFLPQGVFTYRRIREWPHVFGNGCLLEAYPVPELEDILNPLIQHIKYYGIVDAEFKKDPRDGVFKLIEVNARPWMQNNFPARFGINLPYIAYMHAQGKDAGEIRFKNDDVTWLFIFDYLSSSIISMRKGTLSLPEISRLMKRKKEYAVFARDDPLPFAIVFGKSCKVMFHYVTNRSDQQIRTIIFSSDGQKKPKC